MILSALTELAGAVKSLNKKAENTQKRTSHEISDDESDNEIETKRPRMDIDSDSKLQLMHSDKPEGVHHTADDDFLKEIEQ